jgi:hypothetical protein
VELLDVVDLATAHRRVHAPHAVGQVHAAVEIAHELPERVVATRCDGHQLAREVLVAVLVEGDATRLARLAVTRRIRVLVVLVVHARAADHAAAGRQAPVSVRVLVMIVHGSCCHSTPLRLFFSRLIVPLSFLYVYFDLFAVQARVFVFESVCHLIAMIGWVKLRVVLMLLILLLLVSRVSLRLTCFFAC